MGQRKEVRADGSCAITSHKFNQLFSFSELLVVVLGPVSVDELVRVENVPSAPGFR